MQVIFVSIVLILFLKLISKTGIGLKMSAHL